MPATLPETCRVAFAGICGSDLQKLSLSDLDSGQFHTLGHEAVVRYGGGYAVVNPMVGCDSCDMCTQDRPMLCAQLAAMGRNLPGAFGGSVTMPSENIRPIHFARPELGVLCDPYAVAVHGLRSLATVQDAVVVGDGIIGQLSLIYLLHNDIVTRSCTLVVKSQQRVAGLQKLYGPLFAAKNINFVCQPFSVAQAPAALDPSLQPGLVIEAVGRAQPEALNYCIDAASNRGTIISFGVYPVGYQAPLNIRSLLYKEAVLRGSNSYGRADFETAISHMHQHPELFEPLLGTSFPATKWQEAVNRASKKSSRPPQKVIIEFSPETDKPA